MFQQLPDGSRIVDDFILVKVEDFMRHTEIVHCLKNKQQLVKLFQLEFNGIFVEVIIFNQYKQVAIRCFHLFIGFLITNKALI